MLHHLPGKAQGFHLLCCRLALSCHLPSRVILSNRILLLDEQSAPHAPHLPCRILWAGHFQQAAVGALGQNLPGLRSEGRGSDGFDEQIAQGQGYFSIEGTIGGDDAPESRDGVAGQGCSESLRQVGVAGHAAGVTVFDDSQSGSGEVARDPPGSVQIQDVVVGKGFALQQVTTQWARSFAQAVESGLLMRILPVAEVGQLGQVEVQRGGEGRFINTYVRSGCFLEMGGQVAADGGIVAGRVAEGLQCQVTANSGGEVTVLSQLGQDGSVVGGIGHHSNGGEVLGRRPQQGHAADVNLLDGLSERCPRPGNGLGEGVEVDGHQINGGNALGL